MSQRDYAEVIEWCDYDTAKMFFGLEKKRLLDLRARGEIRAKKIPNAEGKRTRSCRVLYSAKSIREWLDGLPDEERKTAQIIEQ